MLPRLGLRLSLLLVLRRRLGLGLLLVLLSRRGLGLVLRRRLR